METERELQSPQMLAPNTSGSSLGIQRLPSVQRTWCPSGEVEQVPRVSLRMNVGQSVLLTQLAPPAPSLGFSTDKPLCNHPSRRSNLFPLTHLGAIFKEKGLELLSKHYCVPQNSFQSTTTTTRHTHTHT